MTIIARENITNHSRQSRSTDSASRSVGSHVAKEIRRTRGFEVWMVMRRDQNGLFYPAHALGTRKQAREFIARQNSYPLLKREMYVQKYGPYR